MSNLKLTIPEYKITKDFIQNMKEFGYTDEYGTDIRTDFGLLNQDTIHKLLINDYDSPLISSIGLNIIFKKSKMDKIQLEVSFLSYWKRSSNDAQDKSKHFILEIYLNGKKEITGVYNENCYYRIPISILNRLYILLQSQNEIKNRNVI
jgi:hypothetical protein